MHLMHRQLLNHAFLPSDGKLKSFTSAEINSFFYS